MSTRKALGSWLALAAVLGLLAADALATARVTGGNLVIDFNLDSAPNKLPRHEDAPIAFWGSGAFQTKDGTTPPPLRRMVFEIDRFGHLETRGLPTCSQAKLAATTAPQARKLCPGAIIGTGTGEGIVEFPEQAPIPARSPLTFFNGPRIGGDPSLIVHAHLTIPAPTTYLIPLRIERIHKGVYGFRVESEFPPIAGGYGSITSFDFRVDRKWQFKGQELSYVYARCPIGRLQARIETEFEDGTRLFTHFIHPCQAR
jgi:hypothetical protein